MKLLTKAIEAKFKKTGSQDGLFGEAICIAKFFNPLGNWRWYALEYEPEDKIFFGWVDGDFPEYGYFGLEELESVKLPFGMGIERDRGFEDVPMKEVEAFKKEWPEKCRD